jgi:hypothetical protein
LEAMCHEKANQIGKWTSERDVDERNLVPVIGGMISGRYEIRGNIGVWILMS